MKKILLTGAQGQVGWELARTLASLGEIHAFGRGELDLTQPDSIRTAMARVQPDIVVNAAAYTAVDKAEAEPEAAFAVNATAPGILAEEVRRLGALLVHYSTDYVFDGSKAGAYTEDDPPCPINVYGRSKLAGEEAIRQRGCRHLIFRISWIYGLRGGNFLLTMLRLARERPELRVVMDQVGAPTWSRLVAEITALALAREQPPEGLYHLGSEDAVSWAGFAREIFRLSGIPVLVRDIPSSEYPLPARRPLNSRLCGRRLRDAIGLALPSWQQGLALCLADESQDVV
ncbi:dTDP-4-dehydrorhamnose reductase [Denitratisoma oestradiolicum]|uniref:dTDP-4-dehydrorhamnose reductase n=1 Tax=Denitratisoma oestradiolicum TaxID=311182 RepID=A0A6S6Y5P4_9PROT|nr:dTDP-4-dehydrorhamnose reductase [Denitratisoma oestradiolicum]TWO81182.1 dTDP-4-dehydrorhamnose reductase [Denitratisoma oestradiolicum]CAB1367878.1 dTDP-4-dehydrorhamnose reductase subunit, NAD(P)-binding, of dTDP-L-rhamnose synthase [Denitratisoma oestradiolicum]